MRHQTREFVDKFVKEHPNKFATALEVGSRDVNGQITDLLTGMAYTGVDMEPGGCVTKVVNGHDLKKYFKKKQFDLVLCFDMLEHDDKFWLTVENMKKVLAPGGYLLIGVPARNCPQHDHPSDYWRFMGAGVATFFEGFDDMQIFPEGDDEIYAYGRKPL